AKFAIARGGWRVNDGLGSYPGNPTAPLLLVCRPLGSDPATTIHFLIFLVSVEHSFPASRQATT
ncbi:MAG: hypothetical protein QOI89_3989, partial [Solirubrobacteraceae bacterium]|nr:hypothetical protein [Solirubrobacteraceae bacterium]